MVKKLRIELTGFRRTIDYIACLMDFTFFLIMSIILSIIFFSSGISVFNEAHIKYLRDISKSNRLLGWLADIALSTIVIMSKVRRAWIRMISPGND